MSQRRPSQRIPKHPVGETARTVAKPQVRDALRNTLAVSDVLSPRAVGQPGVVRDRPHKSCPDVFLFAVTGVAGGFILPPRKVSMQSAVRRPSDPSQSDTESVRSFVIDRDASWCRNGCGSWRFNESIWRSSLTASLTSRVPSAEARRTNKRAGGRGDSVVYVQFGRTKRFSTGDERQQGRRESCAMGAIFKDDVKANEILKKEVARRAHAIN